MATLTINPALIENPIDKLKEEQDQQSKALTMQSLSSGVATGKKLGSALGSVIPGVGNVIGEVAGSALGLIGGAIGNKKKQNKLKIQQQEELSNTQHNYTTGIGKLSQSLNEGEGFKNGGKIKGKGTGKSDSVPMTAEPGSFIVPAENADKGYQLGQDYLGWDDNQVASKKSGNAKIKTSNGEVIYTPDEATALSEYGVNLNELAPNADPNNAYKCGGFVRKMADGGEVTTGDPKKLNYIGKNRAYYTTEKLREMSSYKSDTFTYSPEQIRAAKNGDIIEREKAADGSGYLVKKKGAKYPEWHTSKKTLEGTLKSGSVQKLKDGSWVSDNEVGSVVDEVLSEKSKEDKESFEIPQGIKDAYGKLTESLPEIASAIQIYGGAKGLKNLGEEPDINISKTLQSLASEARNESEFGLPADVKNEIDKKNELSRRSTMRAIGARGGSPLSVMQSMQETMGKSQQANTNLVLADYEAQEKKKETYRDLGLKVAEQETAIDMINKDDYQRNQSIYSELLSSGIKNLIGARQYKSEIDAIKAAGSANPFEAARIAKEEEEAAKIKAEKKEARIKSREERKNNRNNG